MPIDIRTYSISVDFTSLTASVPDAGVLETEINASAISQTPVSYINVGINAPDDVDIAFPDTLLPGDVTLLNGIIAAHTGETRNTQPLQFILTRASNTVTSGTFLRSSDQQPTSSSPIVMPYPVELRNVSASIAGTPSGSWGVEVRKNNTQVVLLTGTTSKLKLSTQGLSVMFDEGDELKVLTDPAGASVRRPNCIVVFRDL